MPNIHEILLFVATLSPVLVVGAINVVLALVGETGTLLIPPPCFYPTLDLSGEPVSEEPVAELEPEPLREAA